MQLYTFVKSLEDPAPTFPNSLLTSLCFAHFVLGLVIVGYGRLRYSDGQRITAMHLDVDGLTDSNDGFLECVAERTKTQTGLAKKRKALPVVIPAQSSKGWRFGARWAWLFQGRTSRSPFFRLRQQGAGGRACPYRSAKLQRG